MKQAEALKLGEVAKANAERDVLMAQKEQEEARLKKEELARQEVEKLKIQVEADAEAERQRRIALGEADAIKAKYFAEAEGIKAVLEAKAKGYEELVKISPLQNRILRREIQGAQEIGRTAYLAYVSSPIIEVQRSSCPLKCDF